jgi:hypothetical protein
MLIVKSGASSIMVPGSRGNLVGWASWSPKESTNSLI